MQVVGEDVGVLVDRAILNDHVVARGEHVERLLDTTTQKIDLQVERPPLHVVVEIADIRIVALLIVGLRVVVPGQYLGQRRLSAADISRNCNVHVVIISFVINSHLPTDVHAAHCRCADADIPSPSPLPLAKGEVQTKSELYILLRYRFTPADGRSCRHLPASAALRRQFAVAPCGEVLSHETARATPTAVGEPRHHSRRDRYPRTPTAASCPAVVASTSSNTLRSLARRGTLFLPRRSIQRANVPAGTTCISGGAIVLRRLAS